MASLVVLSTKDAEVVGLLEAWAAFSSLWEVADLLVAPEDIKIEQIHP